jgi:hypothetical protein
VTRVAAVFVACDLVDLAAGSFGVICFLSATVSPPSSGEHRTSSGAEHGSSVPCVTGLDVMSGNTSL